MKSRNREVNIFNLSMLDVISGALGAVLIIMVVLSSRPGEDETQKLQQELEALRQQLEQGSNDPKMLAELSKKLSEAEAQLRRYQNALNEASKEINRLELRKPILVQIWWSGEDQDVDLYIKRPDSRAEAVDIEKKQGPGFFGDTRTGFRNFLSSEVWVLRDAVPGPYEVYAKLMGEPDQRKETTVWSYYSYNEDGKSDKSGIVGTTKIGPQNRLKKICVLDLDGQGKMTVRTEPGVEPFQ